MIQMNLQKRETPLAVHLKLPQHYQSLIAQEKIENLKSGGKLQFHCLHLFSTSLEQVTKCFLRLVFNAGDFLWSTLILISPQSLSEIYLLIFSWLK